MAKKGWLQNIMDTYNKGSKYDALEEEYLTVCNDLIDVKHDLIESDESLADKSSKLLSEIKKNSVLEEQLKELLNSGKLDILALKTWYENKYEQEPWLYDFDGSGPKDVKRSLRWSTTGEKDLRATAKEIITKYSLTSKSDPSKIPESLMKYFSLKTQWSYVTDKSQFDLIEFWEKAEISLSTRKGDCDDLAILMHVLVYFMLEELGLGDHYWRLKFAAFSLISNEGGHAFNIWLHDDGEWYVVESTYDLKGSLSRTWLKTPIKYNNLYGRPYGFARYDKSWAGSLSSLEKYNKK